MKLQFLPAGRLRLKKSVYIKTADRSETFEAPVSSALIRHRQGNVLFDTGCHPSVIEHGEERWGSLMKVMTPVMRAEDMLLPSLACVGVDPDDIDVVVCSHFHPDHCGCNEFFRKATVMVHAREIEAANAPGAEAAGYLRADWDHGQPTDAITGERDVLAQSALFAGRSQGLDADRRRCGGIAPDIPMARAHCQERSDVVEEVQLLPVVVHDV